MYKVVRSYHFALSLLLVLTVFVSCKSDSSADTAAEKTNEELKKLEKSLESLKEGNGEVVEISVLKDALPEKILGMKRTSHNGQRTGMAGIKIANAEARYEDGDKRLSISITDSGGLGAAFSMLAAWSEIEIDNSSDEGYERTTMIDGKKAIEKFNHNTKQGEISVISADRFIISINSNNLSEKELRSVISEIKIKV